MIHELWSDGTYLRRCPDTGHTDLCGHRLIEPGSKITWTYNARTSNDAMRALFEHLGYEAYEPMKQEDGSNYPEDDALFDDAIDDIIDEWHNGKHPGKQLHEALGWTWVQYAEWMKDSRKVPGR